MMETQKILKPEGKLIVVSDYREKEVIKHLKDFGVLVNEMALEVGDFICSDNRVVIEKKTHSDFVSSIIDGRIFDQVKTMKGNFERPIIIVEGSSDRNITENALKGTIASLLVDYSIPIVSTKNPQDTAKTIYWIAKKEQEEKKYGISFKVGKKPKDTKQLMEEIIASLPGISNVMSKRLLEQFGSVEKIFAASEDDLKKVRGIGDKLAKRIKRIIVEKY